MKWDSVVGEVLWAFLFSSFLFFIVYVCGSIFGLDKKLQSKLFAIHTSNLNSRPSIAMFPALHHQYY